MVNALLIASLGLIGLSFILVVIRFLIGKSLSDRVIALDVLTVSSIGMLVIIGYLLQRIVYLDVAIVYGILSFIGVIVIAKYIDNTL